MDKRKNVQRRSRVQGGWSTAPKTQPARVQSQNKTSQQPAWIGHNVDVPNVSSVQFIQPDEQDLETDHSQIQLISEPGVYDLSDGPSGVSRIKVFHGFLTNEEADKLFDNLSNQIPWEQKSDCKNGIRYLQPRSVAWYGGVEYSYSGLAHPPRTQWLPELRDIQSRLEANIGQEFNSVLCNLYRDGKDNIAWHSDDEFIFGSNPTIASVSLGDIRNFELRRKDNLDDNGVIKSTELVRIPLTHGSLVVMEGAVQKDWQHRVPKEYHDRGPRVNLTYRKVVTE